LRGAIAVAKKKHHASIIDPVEIAKLQRAIEAYEGHFYPPTFNRFNYKKFTKILYIILAKGSDNELPVIADELGRSAESIIKSSKNIEPQNKPKLHKKLPALTTHMIY
jgi:hypothetical protein